MLARLTVRTAFVLIAYLPASGQHGPANEFYTYDLAASRRSPDDWDFRQNLATFFFRGTWTRGSIVSANNITFKNDSFVMNLDKLSQALWVTSDYNRYFEIDRKEFKSVTFYWGDSSYVFEHVYYIDNKNLYQVIIPRGNRYSLFKRIRPVLRKKELPNGLQYSSFIDVPVYYVLFPNKDYRKIKSLKRKSLEKIFSLLPERDRVSDYLYSQGENYSGESYLRNLVAYLNQ